MIIKDANGKVIGSIEFTDKELDKFNNENINTAVNAIKEIALSNNNVILTKSIHFHDTLDNVVNSVKDFNIEMDLNNKCSMFHYDLEKQQQ